MPDQVGACKALLKSGAHPDAENTLGVTPRELAALSRKARPRAVRRIEYLLDNIMPRAPLDPRESSVDKWTRLTLPSSSVP